jgi:hypothetical protein
VLTKSNPQLIKLMAAQLRGLRVSNVRARQLAVEVARVNDAARAAAVNNAFNDEPSRYPVQLSVLKKR